MYVMDAMQAIWMRQTKMINIETRDITPLTDFNENLFSGHSLYTAIRDIVDNCIDAEANDIRLFLDKDSEGKDVFVVTDFGVGMPGDKLHLMAQKGFTTKKSGAVRKDGKRYLGKMGKGFKNVSAFFSNTGRVTVLSKTEDSKLWCMEYSQQRIADMQQHTVDVHECVFRDTNDDKYRSLWIQKMRTGDDWASHGTMLVFRNLKTPVLNQLRRDLGLSAEASQNNTTHCISSMLGETYKYFINDGVDIYTGTNYNGLFKVKPIDEMCGESPQEVINFIVDNQKVSLMLYVIPATYKSSDVWYRPVNNQNSGIFVYRNNRLHLDNQERPLKPLLPEKAIQKYVYERTNGINRRKGKPKDTQDYTSFGESHGRHNTVRMALHFTDLNDTDFAVDVNKTDIQFTDTVADLALWVYDTVRANDRFTPKPQTTTTPQVTKPSGQGVKNTLSKDWINILKKHEREIETRKKSIVDQTMASQRLAVEIGIHQFLEKLTQD